MSLGRYLRSGALSGLTLAMSVCAGYSAVTVDLETGIVSPGYNDIKIPGNTGTRFSLTDSLAVESKAFYRLRLTKEIKKDNFISVLFAPLTLAAEGIVKTPVNYNNDAFAANTAVTAKYRFDSYRVSYWKNYRKSGRLNLKIGFTAKIRDAAISITGGGVESEKKNTGFVPLLNFGADYALGEKLKLIFDADALAGGPGRAEDVLLALQYRTGSNTGFRLGYRFVEGGADTDEVYNFALLNYASAAFILNF